MKKYSLSSDEISFFYSVASPIINSEKFQSLKNFVAHGKVSLFEHVLSVAKLSYARCLNKKNIDKASLIRGALLHDYYLYDWHKNKPFTFHGLTHPKIALENASRDFDLNKKERNIIRSHMFPLTLFHFPKSKEAWIVTMADKKMAALEMKGEKYEFDF